jgi:hypothetical protein
MARLALSKIKQPARALGHIYGRPALGIRSCRPQGFPVVVIISLHAQHVVFARGYFLLKAAYVFIAVTKLGLDDHLAGVVASEETHQGQRHLVEALHHRLPDLWVVVCTLCARYSQFYITPSVNILAHLDLA